MLKNILLFLSTPILLFALNAPTNLIVQPTSKTAVTLDWTDNSDDESGFKIFRDGHLIKFTSANITHFEDTNLNPDTTYTYLVFATNNTQDEIYTNKNIYKTNEKITVSFRHLSEPNLWIGIYPAGTPDDDTDAARWHQINNKIIGDATFNSFPEGTYEVRVFTDNSILKAQTTFKVQAQPKTKKLILAQGGDWLPSMADNMIAKHDEIMNLPFDGYAVVGNSFTNRIMRSNYDVLENDVMDELGGLANLYQGKDMFLSVYIRFPGDLWGEEWDKVTTNFATIAKVAKNLGFKGIIFDDEAYDVSIKQMINFKFPKQSEVEANPDNYEQWEKDGANFTANDSMDEHAYRNYNYDFQTHIKKVISLYQNIMESMVAEFPNIQVLVYHGPIRAHDHSFDKRRYGNHYIIDGSLARENEFVGAIFTGLKRGIGQNAMVHDMGEMYKLRTHEQFARFYQWRKYDMVRDIFNNDLNPTYQWRIPVEDRTNWSETTQQGYMVFNQVENTYAPIFDVQNSTTIGDIKTSLKLALSHTDEYAIYYCHDQEWLMPGYKDHPFVDNTWLNMVKKVNP